MLVGGLAIAPLMEKSELSASSSESDPTTQALPTPRLQISRRDGILTLRGHTIAQRQEKALAETAASTYPGSRVRTRFEPLGILPAHWESASVGVVKMLAHTLSAEATLSATRISVRGVVTDRPRWQRQLDRFRQTLPTGVSLSTDVLIVDTDLDVGAVCARAFASHETGPINFEESSADFRSSALPRLDRVVALARACPGSRVSVTGHTDASGSEAWNRQLSLLRANAVGDYLEEKGIDRGRLAISGAGSAVPIADNATRYGRSQNRRIEIALGNPD